MCSGTWNSKIQWSSPAVFIRQQQKKKSPPVSVMTLRRKRLRLTRRRRAAGAELRLIRRRRRAAEAEMEILNLKLHLENRRILAENERLQEWAGTLRRENLTLRVNLWKRVAAAAAAPLAEVATPGR